MRYNYTSYNIDIKRLPKYQKVEMPKYRDLYPEHKYFLLALPISLLLAFLFEGTGVDYLFGLIAFGSFINIITSIKSEFFSYMNYRHTIKAHNWAVDKRLKDLREQRLTDEV